MWEWRCVIIVTLYVYFVDQCHRYILLISMKLVMTDAWLLSVIQLLGAYITEYNTVTVILVLCSLLTLWVSYKNNMLWICLPWLHVCNLLWICLPWWILNPKQVVDCWWTLYLWTTKEPNQAKRNPINPKQNQYCSVCHLSQVYQTQ